MTKTKDIYSDADRKWPIKKIPTGDEGAKEAFARDYTRKCSACNATPVVNAVGLCGPCTWGEADTANGNW